MVIGSLDVTVIETIEAYQPTRTTTGDLVQQSIKAQRSTLQRGIPLNTPMVLGVNMGFM